MWLVVSISSRQAVQLNVKISKSNSFKMMLKLLFIAFLSNVIVQSVPLPQLEKLNDVISSQVVAADNFATSAISSESDREENIVNNSTNLNFKPGTIINHSLDNAQSTIKNVFSTAAQVTDTIQDRLVNSLKNAGGAVKTTVDEQGKTIGDSVGSVIGTGTQIAETSVNLITSFPKLGFRVLESFGR